jgi:hypothetical protein
MGKCHNKKENIEVEGADEKKPGPITNDDSLKEVGGPMGLEPTRYGDWERKGRCVDF